MHHIPAEERLQPVEDANDAETPFTPIEAISDSEEINQDRLADDGLPLNKPERTIRVLLVDDHALMREGLRQLFERVEDIEVVGEAIDGLEVKTKIRQLHPDVILMDIHMPVINGIAITGQISHEFPEVSVIILSMYHQDQQVLQAMRNGAKGYLLKSASIREVAQAIRTVYAGGMAIEPEMTGTVVNEFRRLSESLSSGQGVEALAEKEIEIIRYVAHGLSNREIAEKLAYSEKTVKNYLSVIFQKLHLRDRTQVAIFALRQGLLPNDE
ncbi:MAG TPA: response regulator transcription factor [Ktedonobacteraceae bacterium]|jgi:DNA-binding NarL/FixJ family response regulator|nr:response regulator transcription factor [Ktedonobacteraceae bacterium]